MNGLLSLIGILLLVMVLFVGLGAMIGLLLEWALAIDRSFAVLIGSLSVGLALQLLGQLINCAGTITGNDDTEDDDDWPEVVSPPARSGRRRQRQSKQ